MENRTKVLFVQQISDNEYETESLWCKTDGNNFIVDNIPFVAKRISLGDTIEAEYDDDHHQYYFEDFIENSGNSTVRIYLYNDFINEMQEIRNWLTVAGCLSEIFFGRNIIAVNVPQDISYQPIKKYLDSGEGKKWTYEESCLEHDY